MSLKFVLDKKNKQLVKSIREPWGEVDTGRGSFTSLKKWLKEQNTKNVYVVGDVTAKRIFEKEKIKPHVCIIDGKGANAEGGKLTQADFGWKPKMKRTVKAENPAGAVTGELWDAVRDASREGDTLIIVDGEEDLAVLPVVMFADDSDIIFYGQPKVEGYGEGMVILQPGYARPQVASYFIDYMLERGRKFFDDLPQRGKVCIVHHTDTDGCCSAAIVEKWLRENRKKVKVKRIPTGPTPRIDKDMQDTVSKFKPGALIVVDAGASDSRYLKKAAKSIPVCMIDHHPVHDDDFGGCVAVNPHLIAVPDKYNPSASYFCYRVLQVASWLAVVGSIGDRGEAKIKHLMDQAGHKVGATEQEMRRLSKIIYAAEQSDRPNVGSVVVELVKAEGPQKLLGNGPKIIKSLTKIRDEIDKEIFAKSKGDIGKVDKEKRLIVCRVDSKYGIKAEVAEAISNDHPDYLVLAYMKEGLDYVFSARTKGKLNLTKIMREAAERAHGYGGGHAAAAGAKIPAQNLGMFIKAVEGQI